MILCVSLPAAKRFDNSSDVWSPVVACLAPNRYLVSQGCIKPLCDLLTCNDPRLVTVALEGIENVLKAGELDAQANSATNPYTTFVDEAEGLDKLEQLQARQMSGEGLVVQLRNINTCLHCLHCSVFMLQMAEPSKRGCLQEGRAHSRNVLRVRRRGG